MIKTSITVKRTINLGDYNSVTGEITALVNEFDDIEIVLNELKTEIESAFLGPHDKKRVSEKSDPTELIIDFGKYKDQKLGDIKIDSKFKSYISWLKNNSKPGDKSQQLLSAIDELGIAAW